MTTEMTPATSHAQTLLRDLFARQGLLPNIVLESDHSSAPQTLVRSGLGLALLREDVAVPMAEHDQAIVAALSVLRTVWGLPTR